MKRQFTMGVAWSSLGSWIEQITSVAAFVLIARLIDPEAFGIAWMAFAFLLLGEFLIRDTFAESVIEARELKPGQLEATFFVASGAALLLALGLVATAGPIAALYGQPIVAPFIVATSPTILIIGLSSVSTALLRRAQRYRTIAIRDIVASVLGAVIGIGMALMDFGAWSLAGQRLAVVGTYGVFDVIAAGWLPRRMPRGSDFRLVHGLAAKVLVLRAASIVISQTPTVLLGVASQPAAVGLFAIAARLVEMVQLLIVKPIRSVAQPALAAVRREGKETPSLFLDLVEVTALASFAIFAGLALVAAPFLSILMGPSWADAVGPLPLLCLSGALIAVSVVQEGYLMAINRTGKFVAAAVFEAILGILVIAIAAPLGIVAVAGAVALRSAIALPLRTAATLPADRIALSDFMARLLVPCVPTLGMALVVGGWLLTVRPALGDIGILAGAIVLGSVVFAGIVWFAMPALKNRLMSFLFSD